MLEKLTLLIPTHNRHDYLSRALAYYKDSGIHTVVADSTNQPFKEKNLYPKIEYLHYPNQSYSNKLPAAFAHIKTPYIVMCADDDFIVIETLIKCLQFLEKNSDFSVAMGTNIYFSQKKNNKIDIELAPVYKGKLDYIIDDENPFERLQKMFDNYRTVYYGLHRTEILMASYENTEAIKNLLLYEYISGLYPLIAGKVMGFKDLYQMREYIGIPQAGLPNIDKIFSDDAVRSEYEKLLDQQSNLISAKSGYEAILVRNKLNDALMKYAKHYELPPFQYIKSQLKVKGIWFLLSDSLDFFPIKSMKSFINKLRLKPIGSQQKNQEHIKKIKDFIVNYYTQKKNNKHT